jgi:hypothetical protein
MKKTKERPATLVVTDKVRMSYPHVFTPASYEDGPLKYSLTILIPKNSKQVKRIQAGIEAAKQQWREKFGNGKLPSTNFKLPLRDGDEVHGPDSDKPDENYEGMYFIGCSSPRKPQVVDQQGNPLSPEEFYAGCYGRVSINFFPYNKKGKGVAAGLNNCLFLEDGEPLSGGTTAEDDFDLSSADDYDDDL